MSGSEIARVVAGPDGAPNMGEEDARQFISKVKQTVERCLAQGMSKAQMFRVIREEGLHPVVAFAVYSELRDQNRGFFQEYYCTVDLKEQRKRLDHLVRAYRTGGCDAEDDGVRLPEMVTPLMAMEETDVPVNMEWPDQQALQAWLSDGCHQLAPAAWPHHQAVDLPPAREHVPNKGRQVANAGVAWPQQALNLPAGQLRHDHQQPAGNGGMLQGLTWPQQAAQLHYHEQAGANGLPPLTSPAGLHKDAMIDLDPWPMSHGDQSLWQDGILEQWWRGASANPSPSPSLSEPPENQNY